MSDRNGFDGIDPDAVPSGTGCQECEAAEGWWVVGETWFWDYRSQRVFEGPELAPPQQRPDAQPVPGPAGRVPADWRAHVH
jgi:hypothetical protein